MTRVTAACGCEHRLYIQPPKFFIPGDGGLALKNTLEHGLVEFSVPGCSPPLGSSFSESGVFALDTRLVM
jgi:hypothetical protein